MATSAVVPDLSHSYAHSPSSITQSLAHSPQPTSSHPHSPTPQDITLSRKSNVGEEKERTCILPYIDGPRGGALVQNREGRGTSPSSVGPMNNFLPRDLILSLKCLGTVSDAPPRGGARLPPTRQLHPKLLSLEGSATPAPANVWNYPGRRGRLRHLTEHPPCICGAGRSVLRTKQDLNWLVQVSSNTW